MATASQQNHKKNQSLIIISVIVVIILVVSFFIAMNSHTRNSSLSTFKTRYLSAFMQSCEKVEGNTNTTLCLCIGNHLLTSYDNMQLMDISMEYRSTGRIPQQVVNAATICRSAK